nr:complement decay-accelerating factor-like isoform X3 [Pelodiscus sinensis]|eukprot:XP_025034328.1 complement decay-accelerating factor-like isoform X3 [Pelodiscus sinensis]
MKATSPEMWVKFTEQLHRKQFCDCGALPTRENAIPLDTRTGGFPVESKVQYKCINGSVKIPGKPDTAVCLANSQWRLNGIFCGRSCGVPPRFRSAAVSKEDEMKSYYPPGTTVTYVCRPGYEPTELMPSATCLENVTWSESPEFCTRKSCPAPEGPKNGRVVDGTDYLFGTRVNITCNHGFKLRGRNFIQCVLNGNPWTQLPTCEAISCLPPLNITHGSHNRLGEEEFIFGSAVTYFCDEGFSLIGEASIHCTTNDQVNGEWSGQAPECKGKPCRQLEVENGRVELFDLHFGATVSFSCDDGYRMIGPASAQCVLRGNGVDWDKEVPRCKAIPCLPPPNIPHGSHNHLGEEEFVFGSLVTYSCDKGFSLVGEASIHCTTNDRISGEWSGPAPECKDSASDTAANSPQAGDEDIKKPIIITLIVSGAIIAIGSLASLAAFARKHPGKIWRKKKRSYNVSLDSSVCQMSEEQTKKMLI